MGNSIIETKCLVCGGSGMVYKQQGESVLASDYQQTVEALRAEIRRLSKALAKCGDCIDINQECVEKHDENKHEMTDDEYFYKHRKEFTESEE